MLRKFIAYIYYLVLSSKNLPSSKTKSDSSREEKEQFRPSRPSFISWNEKYSTIQISFTQWTFKMPSHTKQQNHIPWTWEEDADWDSGAEETAEVEKEEEHGCGDRGTKGLGSEGIDGRPQELLPIPAVIVLSRSFLVRVLEMEAAAIFDQQDPAFITV